MGSPLSVVVFGVSSLEEARAFYGDIIGLDASQEAVWSGPEFEQLWQLPPGASARTMLFSLGDSPVGRILALEFDAPHRELVASTDDRTFRAFWNINFYVDDVDAAVAYLKSKNCQIWSEPFEYKTSDDMGAWREAVAIGPDNMTIILLQLPSDMNTKVGVVGVETEVAGKSKAGFSQIATTSHSVSSFEKSKEFYQSVLGLEPFIEEVMEDEYLNTLNSRPKDGQTRWAFMKGDHLYGKIVISYPINYDVPNRIPVAVPPNIGYLAQGFFVEDIHKAETNCAAVSAETFSALNRIDIPSLGVIDAMIVRNPGSEGLTLIMSKA
jgi:catechol 2,3-dioxygenase-like lactoylglutathione lyase family enzyme